MKDKEHRKWKSMSDRNIVRYAKKNNYLGLSITEIQQMDGTFYSVALRRGLIDKIFSRKKPVPIQWHKMSNADLIRYARSHGLWGKSRNQVLREVPGFYRMMRLRGLDEEAFTRISRQNRNWFELKNSDILKYAKEHGFYRINPAEAQKRDPGFYNVVRKRHLLNTIFVRAKSQEGRDWSLMSDQEIIRHSKKSGFYGLSLGEVIALDSVFYDVVRKRGLADKVFTRRVLKKRNWELMNDDELIEYGKNNSLVGLTISTVYKKDSGYYKAVRKRGLVDRLFLRVQIKTKDITELFEKNEVSSTLVDLSTINGYTSEVAHILTQEWPDRFPSYEEAMRRLPQIVPKVVSALEPISPGAGINVENLERFVGLLSHDFSQRTRLDLSDILYQIGLQEYQGPFNQSPKRALAKLERKVKTAANKEVSQLYKKVYSFFKEVYKFDIPGYGSLAMRK